MTARQAMLRHTAEVVDQRRQAYGRPTPSMAAIAARWSMTLGGPVTPAQVVLCLIDLKLARLGHDPRTATPSSTSSATRRCCRRFWRVATSPRSSGQQPMQLGPERLGGHVDRRQRDRQPETPRPGAAGVEEDHAVSGLDVGRCEWPKITMAKPATTGSRSSSPISCSA